MPGRLATSTVKMATLSPLPILRQRLYDSPVFTELATSRWLKRTLLNRLCRFVKLISEYIHN